MKLFLLGDFVSDNGPGNANKQIRDTLADIYKTEYSRASGKFSRIVEMYKGVRKADILLICSKSKINYMAINIAKQLEKKIIYLVHGCASYEVVIKNSFVSEKQLNAIKRYETIVYDASDQIVCVSKSCMEFVKKQFPQYEGKIDYIYNVVDVNKIKNVCQKKNYLRQGNKILSVGGGMRQKNNLIIAETIDKNFNNVKYVVVGDMQEDGEKIKKFGSVTCIGSLTHETLLQLMNETDLYIQNSIFETFGLAIIEALYAGCSLLVSQTVGCMELFESITDMDIIYDTSNEMEISEKITYLLREPNNKRLLDGFKAECVSKEYQSSKWHEILMKLKKREDSI